MDNILDIECKKRITKPKFIEWLTGYSFIILPFLGLFLFVGIPLVMSLCYSFTSYNLMSEPIFIGLENYKNVFRDEIFYQALLNILIACIGIPITLILAFTFSYLLTRKIKLVGVYRTIFYIPVVCSVVATSVVWRMIFNYNYGILNNILAIFKLEPVDWLNNEKVVMFSMIIQGVWGSLGTSIVMFMSAIQNVPSTLYEAAKIDGANTFKTLMRITIPQVSPTTFYLFITSLMGTLQDFSRYQVMTDGGPNFKSTTPVLYVYNYVFGGLGGDNSFGYASALAWVIGIVIMVLVLINFKTSTKWVSYDR